MIAGVLPSTSLLPQLIKLIKEKKRRSMCCYADHLMTGIAFWIYFEIMREYQPIKK